MREGNPLEYRIQGDPGDLVALGFALAPAPLYLPILNGSLLLDLSFVAIPVGSIPASGTLRLATTVPTLGVDVQRYYVQLIAINPSQVQAFGGSGQALTLLRSGF